MFRQFLKDSAIYGIANILARGISLLLLPFYTRELTQTDFGIVDIFTVFTALVSLTIALEVTQAVAIYYTEAKDETDKKHYASTALWFTVSIYAVFVVICQFFAAPLSELLLGTADKVIIFRVALFSTLSYGLLYMALNQLRWQLQPAQYALASLVTTLTTISTTILFVLVLHMGALGVVCGQLAGNAIGGALALYLSRSSYLPIFDWIKFKQMLRFSVPLVPSSVGVFAMLYIDRLAIRSLMTLADVGIFGVAYRLTTVVNLIMAGIRSSLTPLIYNRYQEEDTPEAIARIFRYFVAMGLLMIAGMSLFAREILMIFTTPEYYEAVTVIPLLVTAVLLGEMYIFAPGLTIVKRTTAIATINIIGALMTTGLNLLLIPMIGISGAALANLITNGLVFTMNMVFSQRTYRVPHSWLRVISAAGCTAVLILAGTQIQASLWLGIVIKSGLFLSAALVMVVFRLVEREKIMDIMRTLPTQIMTFMKR